MFCGNKQAWTGRSTLQPAGRPALQFHALRVGESRWGTVTETQALAFCGIHVLSPQIFAKMMDEGVFSIIDTYMHLAAQREKIIAFRADDCYWRDLGRPESIEQAAADLSGGLRQS